MIARVPLPWRAPLALLAALWALILAVFGGDAAAMVFLWWNVSTFNHMLLMVPLIGWLVAQRAPQLASLTPRPWWPGAALVGLAALVWLLGEAAGAAVLRHAGLVLMLQAAVAAALGPMLVRALAFPLGYALLLVPFGDGLVPLFQDITADLSMLLLAATGIPAQRDGILITTPGGFFEVAEACSGVMFLIAMLAFAVLAAHLCFTRWTRRIVFVAGALAATVIANGLRAFGTIWFAEHFGIEHAAGFDHIVYGWVFFAAIIIAVMLVARRWFDRPANAPAVDVTGLDRQVGWSGSPLAIGAAVAVLLLAAPGWAALSAQRQGELPRQVTLPAVPGWTMGGTPDPAWKARFDGADHFLQRRYTDALGRHVDVALASFARQAEGREIVGYAQGAVDPASGWIVSQAAAPVAGAPAQRLFLPGGHVRDAASWYVVAGTLVTDPRAAKLYGLKARLTGGDPRAAALVLSSPQGSAAMADWLAAAGGARIVADRALETR